MSARGRLVKRRIYSAVDKSKIKDKRKVKPKDKSWVKIAACMTPSCMGTEFEVEELPVSVSALFTLPMEVDSLLFLSFVILYRNVCLAFNTIGLRECKTNL